MCNNCIHKPVCSRYTATGGVRECEHYKEERRGRWLNWKGEPIPKDEIRWSWTCSECEHEMEFEEAVSADEFASNFCPNCGADMTSKKVPGDCHGLRPRNDTEVGGADMAAAEDSPSAQGGD